MTVGKNKKKPGTGGGARGKKRKTVDPMIDKEWYDVVAPAIFKRRQFCKTICTKTKGTKLARDNLIDRVFEVNLADLNESTNREVSHRKVKLRVAEVRGRNLLTQFHSLGITTDKMREILRKRCSLIETVADAKTVDGFSLRVFVICCTKRQPNQLSRNCHPPARLKKWVRHRMSSMIRSKLSRCDIIQAVQQFTQDTLTDALFKRCNPILPIRDVKITKVKTLQRPKLDMRKFLESHGEIPQSREDVVAMADEAN